MVSHPIALVGRAHQGRNDTYILCETLHDLYMQFGTPSKTCSGLYYAVHALLYKKPVLFLRSDEQEQDYSKKLTQLVEQANSISALFLPEANDPKIVATGQKLCERLERPFLHDERAFYDFATDYRYR